MNKAVLKTALAKIHNLTLQNAYSKTSHVKLFENLFFLLFVREPQKLFHWTLMTYLRRFNTTVTARLQIITIENILNKI